MICRFCSSEKEIILSLKFPPLYATIEETAESCIILCPEAYINVDENSGEDL